MSYTAGPWKVRHDEGVSRIFTKTKIADVYSEAFRDQKTQQDNAHLVSAAPDLLAACKAMVADEAFEDLCQGIGEKPEWLEMAKSAIAKAQP